MTRRIRKVTWSTICREGDEWRGFMRITGALEPVLVRAETRERVEFLMVKYLAERGIRLPKLWNFVEREGAHG